MYPAYLRELGYYCTNSSKEDYNLRKEGEVWNESSRKGHWKTVPTRRNRFLPSSTSRQVTKAESAKRPHTQVHDPSKVRVPAYHPDHPEVRQGLGPVPRQDHRDGRPSRGEAQGIEGCRIGRRHHRFLLRRSRIRMPRSKRWPFFSGINASHRACPREMETPGRIRLQGRRQQRSPGWVHRPRPYPPEHCRQETTRPYARPRLHGQARSSSPGIRIRFPRTNGRALRHESAAVGKRYIYIRNYMPHKLYGQHAGYMFVTTTTQVWKRLFDEGKLNETRATSGKPNRPKNFMTCKKTRMRV